MSPRAVEHDRALFTRAVLFYLGLAAALPAWLDPTVWLISAALVVAMMVALPGWRHVYDWASAKPYLALAASAAGMAVLSGLWAWDLDSLYDAMTFGVWLLFIVPGLVGLLRDSRNRRVLMLGLAIGTAVYGVVSALRIASGQSVLDVTGEGELNTIIGLNRNAVNMRAVIVAPFLVWWARARPTSPVRWFLFGAVSFAVLASGGRAGLIALASALLLYAMLQPGVGRRVRTVLVISTVVMVVLTGVRGAGGPVSGGVDRVVAYLHGERTGSDEARELLVDKAWAVAKENPVLGIGLRNFRGIEHPIALEGSSSRVRYTVRKGVAHNTYAQALAELGFGGAILVFSLLGTVLWIGVRFSRSRDVRLVTSGLGGFLLIIFFDSALGASLLYLSMALVLGAVLDARTRAVQPITVPTSRAADQQEP